MILTPRISKLRNSESVQFFVDVITLCKDNKASELNLQKPLAELEKSSKALSTSFKKEQASALTTELTELDNRRDLAIICLRKLADGYRSHHDEAKKKAGKLLVAVIDKYGKAIARMNYQAETGVLTSLGADLKDDAKNAAAVKLLGLGDTVTEMATANNLFNKTYIERVGEAATNDIVSASDMVTDCKDKFAALVMHIEANAVIAPSEGLDTLMKQLNSLIEKFNTMLAMRGGRKGDDKEEDDTPTDEQ
jgi:hypothetical protein